MGEVFPRNLVLYLHITIFNVSIHIQVLIITRTTLHMQEPVRHKPLSFSRLFHIKVDTRFYSTR